MDHRQQQVQTIIGISPGTRTLGIAIMRGRELLEARVKSFPGKWSGSKLKTILGIISEFLDDFGITTLVLKTIHESRSSAALNQVIHEIKEIAEKRKLKFVICTIKEIKKYCSGGEKGNKDLIIGFMERNYSELLFACKKERFNKNRYYIKMFEAVICALEH